MQRNVWQRSEDIWTSSKGTQRYHCAAAAAAKSGVVASLLTVVSEIRYPKAMRPRNPNPFCPGRRSILPAVYVAVFAREELAVLVRALAAGQGGAGQLPGRLRGALAAADQRLLLAWLLSSVWGCRLTYNFWRKGGYRLSFEDYR